MIPRQLCKNPLCRLGDDGGPRWFTRKDKGRPPKYCCIACSQAMALKAWKARQKTGTTATNDPVELFMERKCPSCHRTFVPYLTYETYEDLDLLTLAQKAKINPRDKTVDNRTRYVNRLPYCDGICETASEMIIPLIQDDGKVNEVWLKFQEREQAHAKTIVARRLAGLAPDEKASAINPDTLAEEPPETIGTPKPLALPPPISGDTSHWNKLPKAPRWNSLPLKD